GALDRRRDEIFRGHRGSSQWRQIAGLPEKGGVDDGKLRARGYLQHPGWGTHVSNRRSWGRILYPSPVHHGGRLEPPRSRGSTWNDSPLAQDGVPVCRTSPAPSVLQARSAASLA